jgi:zinc transport system substrate-binding protein
VDTRPVVLVTVPPQAFVVERIAGDLVRVETLLSGGGDPHHHEPSFDELRSVSEADLWVKVGHPDFSFETAWLDRLLADSPGLVVVDGAAGAKLIPGDPHLWLAPNNAASLATAVTEALMELLPGSSETLLGNRNDFVLDALALDAELRETLAPVEGQWFLVVHPAWGYLAEEYGLEQVAIERDGREPDPATLAALVERGRAAKLPVVFLEPQFHDHAARVVADEIGARVEVIDPLAHDWDANLRRVAAALLAGSAP